jgi:hypothetical protein
MPGKHAVLVGLLERKPFTNQGSYEYDGFFANARLDHIRNAVLGLMNHTNRDGVNGGCRWVTWGSDVAS